MANMAERSSATAPTEPLLAKRNTKVDDSKQQRRRERKKRIRRQRSDYERSGSNDKGSVLFLLLLVGLAFCLIDVFYVMNYVDNLMGYDTNIGQPVSKQEESSDSSNSNIEDANQNADPRHDKERILQILSEAGIDNVDDETIRKLPTWSKVTSLYGDHPRIYGLEQCEAFRKRSDPADHFLAVAGAFNSGTNLMSELLIHNCHMPARMKKYGVENRGIRWQVPWGKHNPPSDEEYRQSHKTQKDRNVDANNVLPAVTIRDPYSWMGSMCRIHYEARWAHTDHRCPNLVPSLYDKAQFPRLITKNSVPVRVTYNGIFTKHDSLAHMWNDWYADYVNADFPRIIVRFEDLVFFAREMTETVCKCAGGEMNRGGFRYIVNSAKKGIGAHGAMSERTSMIDAMIRYGTDRKRFKGFQKEDLLFANRTLNRDLLDFFGYSDPPARLVT